MKKDYHEEFTAADIGSLSQGAIVRRIGGGKDQQGRFVKPSDDGAGMVLVDVVDLEKHEFLTEGGIVKPQDGDQLLKHKANFENSDRAEAAMQVLKAWPLYRDNENLREAIEAFVKNAFSPEEILTFKKEDTLKPFFVTIQHRFQIGRHTPKIDWEKVRWERFQENLDALYDGKHLTYVAFIPSDMNHDPKFFSIGTKPHVETVKQLEREDFYFKPTNGGHIKVVSQTNETPRRFIVDAGSNEYGAGVKSSISTAELVCDMLDKEHPGAEYIPVKGRDAYGVQQSY
jgi:hypothetical protein